jgi:Fe-S oxidoreductase
MDRLFQGVDPKTAREKEQITPSKLVVDLTGVESASEVAAAPGTQPTERQARLEAQRCLNCACLSCLPACPYLRSRKGYPKKYAREFYNNIITAFGIRHSNIHINSCAQCGLCGVVCPNGADLGKFVESARFDMVAQNHMPVSAHEFALEDQVFSNSEQASFSRPQLGFESSKHLFFPGCQLTASLPKAVKALYLHLTRRLEGGVGLFSACCGAPARWSGREILTRKTVSFLLATWEKAGFPTVILACPSCRLFFLKELPQIPIKSLWTVLAQLPSPKRPLAIDSPLFIHDPCAARFDAESQDGVRALMATIGQKIVEPKMTRKYTLCCGYGGLAAHANPEMGRRYVFERTNASPGPFLAWCVMCRDRFLETGQKAYHPLDLLFSEDGVNEDDVEQDGVKRNDVDHDGVYQNNVKQDDVKRNDVDHDGVYQNNVKQDGVDEDEIDSDKRRPGVPNLPAAPNISDRRRNRSFFKRLMLQTVWLEPAEEKDMSLNIDIPDSVLKEMEARRILFDDVAMVLQEAEKSGPMFVNPQTKLMIATLKPRQVTFWVEYEELANGVKKVHRAWCHRMTLPNIAGQALESPASEEGFARDGGRV